MPRLTRGSGSAGHHHGLALEAREAYQELWDCTRGGWDSNPRAPTLPGALAEGLDPGSPDRPLQAPPRAHLDTARREDSTVRGRACQDQPVTPARCGSR